MATIHLGTEVVSVARGALNKMESIGGADFRMPTNKPLADKFRQDTPFDILVSADGVERVEEGFNFVVDCTGFYKKDQANWVGKGGVPALGERSLRSSGRIWNTVPDILGKDRARFAGKRTMLVGSGMSAATTVRFTTDLAKEAPGTELLWLVRSVGEPFKVKEDDPMEAHKRLEEFGNSAARGEVAGVQYLSGSAVQSIKKVGDRLQVTVQTVDGTRVEEIDEVVSSLTRPSSKSCRCNCATPLMVLTSWLRPLWPEDKRVAWNRLLRVPRRWLPSSQVSSSWATSHMVEVHRFSCGSDMSRSMASWS